jgi:hypothetical protein
MKWILIVSLLCLVTGCMDISPLRPELDQRIDNQNGKIDDIKNNQNGVMLELMKLQNKQEIMARDIGNLQTGLINSSNQNSGVQILQGDGGLIFVFALGTIALLLIYHYRSKYRESDKAANLLAQQVTHYNDIELENEVFLAALNSDVEEKVYHLMVNHQMNRGIS